MNFERKAISLPARAEDLMLEYVGTSSDESEEFDDVFDACDERSEVKFFR